MSAPNGRLLTFLCAFIGGTLGSAALRFLHAPGIVLGGLFGSAAGWVAARWIVRKIF